MTIDLYYLDVSPPCRAVLATAQKIGIVLNIKNIDFKGGQHRTEEFLQLNPNHTVPTLVDNGFALWESGAIMPYLVEKFKPSSSIYPKNDTHRALVNQILQFASGSFMAAFRGGMYYVYMLKQRPPEENLKTLKEQISVVEKMLGEKKLITGDTLTLADIAIGAILSSLELIEEGITPPTLLEYLDRVYKACPHLMEINKQYLADPHID